MKHLFQLQLSSIQRNALRVIFALVELKLKSLLRPYMEEASALVVNIAPLDHQQSLIAQEDIMTNAKESLYV